MPFKPPFMFARGVENNAPTIAHGRIRHWRTDFGLALRLGIPLRYGMPLVADLDRRIRPVGHEYRALVASRDGSAGAGRLGA